MNERRERGVGENAGYDIIKLFGSPMDWNVAIAPVGMFSGSNGDTVPNSNPAQTFADVKSVRVAAFSTSFVPFLCALRQLTAIGGRTHALGDGRCGTW